MLYLNIDLNLELRMSKYRKMIILILKMFLSIFFFSTLNVKIGLCSIT